MAQWWKGMFQGRRGTAPTPPVTPAQRAEAAAVTAQTAEQKAWAQRLARVAAERTALYEAQAAAERAAQEAEIERRRAAVEEIKEICARNHGWYFPGDRLVRRESSSRGLARLLDILRGR